MPRRYAMTVLILRAQQRVDMVNDGLIDRDEWCTLISEAYGELYNIVWEVGNEYFEYTEILTTDGTNVLDEIADHLSTVELTYLVNGTTDGLRRDLRPAEAQERSRLSGRTGEPRYYALVDDKIYLYPTPVTGTVLELRYVPQPPELVEFFEDEEVLVDVVTPDGLTFLLETVAMKAKAKAEIEAGVHAAEREAARLRFTESAVLRSINTGHHRVIDKGGGLLDGYPGTVYRDDADWWPR